MTAWRPQPGPQSEAIKLAPIVQELFYGGAVFGGKSDFILGDFAQDVPRVGNAWHGVLFRESYPQLEALIARAKEMYPAWFGSTLDKMWSVQHKMFTFPNGATLKMRFAESEDDWEEYSGASFGWIGWDELPLMSTPTNYLRLKARLRSAGVEIPQKRIRATGNPGGALHAWVKDYWRIGEYPLGRTLFREDGMSRMFLRSRLEDNALGLKNDPEYEARLQGLGSPELVRAWRDGDWEVVQGAFFSEFNSARHVIKPLALPSHWMRYRSMDWGSSTTFCVHWFAVSDGTLDLFPRAALVMYREWYGAAPKKFNVGLKMPAEAVGREIARLESREKVSFGVLDPSAFSHASGPSIAERLAAPGGVMFSPADNTRVGNRGAMGGWDNVRARLQGDEDGRPMLYMFDTCTGIIRTLPTMQHDAHKPEDMQTHGEDHAPDSLRYGCQARPWVRGSAVPKPGYTTVVAPDGRIVPVFALGRGKAGRPMPTVGDIFAKVRRQAKRGKNDFEELFR